MNELKKERMNVNDGMTRRQDEPSASDSVATRPETPWVPGAKTKLL